MGNKYWAENWNHAWPEFYPQMKSIELSSGKRDSLYGRGSRGTVTEQSATERGRRHGYVMSRSFSEATDSSSAASVARSDVRIRSLAPSVTHSLTTDTPQCQRPRETASKRATERPLLPRDLAWQLKGSRSLSTTDGASRRAGGRASALGEDM